MPDSPKDFFISYNSADRRWAEWIAWQLEDAGYTSILQAWDFLAGSNFVLEMDKAAKEAERTIAVLSPDYLSARFTQPEWAAALHQDPTGTKGTLLPVRIRRCEPKGLLGLIIYIDLVDLEEPVARDTLLAQVNRGRAKPKAVPTFPGGAAKSATPTSTPQVSTDTLNVLPEQQPKYPKDLPPITKTVEIFYSYAKEDEDLRNKLEAHLRTLQRQGLISGWDKWKISPGQEHEKELNKHLNKAHIILLLVSADFISSDDCYYVEKRAMERQAAGEARVIPVILRPTDWQHTSFSKLSVLPTGGTPVTKWTDRDDAFLDIAKGIRQVVEEIVKP